ncbi:MAG: ABC transporter substrate-binding protein [Synergistales bacterium]|nr:ABC transporter substrate-binding protein [Synergistales bacterium]
MKRSSAVLVAAAAAFLLALVLWLGADRQPIRIGFAGTLTGDLSDLGVQGRNGAILAVEEINDRGGVNGRRLELIAKDDGGDPRQAKAVDRQLIEADVTAIVGHMTSSLTIAALPVTEAAGTVLFSPTTSTPKLSGKEDLFFRLNPASDTEARALAHYARRTRELDSVGILWDSDNQAYAEPFTEAFRSQFEEEGGAVPAVCRYSSSSPTEWNEQLHRIRQSDAQGILLVSSARDTATFVQQLRKENRDWALLSSGWAATGALHQYCGSPCRGVLFAGSFVTGEPPEAMRDFRRRYRERFGASASFAAELAYDTIRILAQALQQTEGRTGNLPEALVAIDGFPGLSGPISLDRYGDVSSPVTIMELRDERFEPIATVEPEELRLPGTAVR